MRKKLEPEDHMLVQDTISMRQSAYGEFSSNAAIAQQFKHTMRSTPSWDKLSGVQKEAMEMIATKMARILNGDPDHADSWHDIAGYAHLVETRVVSLKRLVPASHSKGQ